MTASAQSNSAAPRPRRKKMGRPTKLNAAIQEAICEKLRAGNVPETAAISEGIARRTFFEWLERGRKGEPLYREFQLAVDQAIAEFEVTVVDQAVSDPKNAVAILERRFPSRWGRKDQTRVDVSVTARPYLDPSKLSLEELRMLQGLLAKGAPDDVPQGGVAAGELVASVIEGEVISEEDVA